MVPIKLTQLRSMVNLEMDQNQMPIILHSSGASHAREMISAGNVDTTSSWSFSSEDGNSLLGENGEDWQNYSSFHLGEDTDESDKTKEKWKYPFGKENKIYRSALRAIRSRASQQGATAIFNEAGRLMDMMDKMDDDDNEEHMRSRNVLQFRQKSFIKQKSRQDDDSVIDMDIFGVIGGGGFFSDDGITQEDFAKQLKAVPKQAKTIALRLSSPGGDVFHGRAIANMIKQSALKFNINVIGEASSAASIIAMAGDTIHMAQGTLMLIHRCYTLALGNALEMEKIAKELNVIDQEAVSTYARKTGMSRDAIISLMDENRYMTAKEALQKGFVDSIDEDISQSTSLRIAALNDSDRKKLHLPPLPENLRPNRTAALAIVERMKK